MPIPGIVERDPEQEDKRSLLERLGGLGGLLGGGIRAISGVASAEGGPIGAGISGAGEAAAQIAEGSAFRPSPIDPESTVGKLQAAIDPRSLEQTPGQAQLRGFLAGALSPFAKIATAAGLGAVPFGAVLKEGKPLASAVRGAVYSGTGAAGRELASGQQLDPGAIGTSAALGGAVTGGLAKLLGTPTSTTPTEKTYIIEPTSRASAPTKLQRGMEAPRPIKASGQPIQAETAIGEPTTAGAGYRGEEPAPYRASARRAIAEEVKAARAQQKADEEAAAAARIAKAKEGLVPREPSISESISAPIPGGRERMSTSYVKPKPEPPSSGPQVPPEVIPPRVSEPTSTAPIAPKDPKAVVPVEAQAPPTPEVQALKTTTIPDDVDRDLNSRLAPWGMGGIFPNPMRPSELELAPRGEFMGEGFPLTLQRTAEGGLASRADVSGEHYRALQDLFKSSGEPRTSSLGQGARVAGRALRREGDEEAARLAGASTAPQQATPEAPTPDWVNEQLSLVDRLRALAKGEEGSAPLPNGERGAIPAAYLARLGLGAAGALVGGATDPLGNPLLSALAGGAAGAALPSGINYLRNMGVPSHLLDNIHERIQTPEGIEDTAHRIWQSIPNIQRFNYLSSGPGIIANAWFGPYGSAVKASIEHGLSGDPRGWEALKTLSPRNFFNEYRQSLGEAKELIEKGEMGRAEYDPAKGAGVMTHVLQMPGTLMVAGDAAARRLLTAAGFTEDEARRITLTSEPMGKLTRSLTNVGRGSALGNVLFPFRRTPLNILEQGAMRAPGIGGLVQRGLERETGGAFQAAPLKQQLVQQAMAAGETGLGYLAGSELDPESSKQARRFMSNFGGQYAMYPAIGMAMGQAARQGKTTAEQAGAGALAGVRDIPLPTTKTLEDIINLIKTGKLPTGAYPAVLREIFPASTGPSIAPTIPGIDYRP